ncbi:hypothetical protein EGJ55_11660 [Pseudomonas moraviensis]|nr:hypothetical protein DMX04_25190 [Pseudomonas koreensis]RRW55757.1 hypothetical protein EGJ55_11660 [Pseudomonas moraviensis]
MRGFGFSCKACEFPPHPSPLPEGEGTDWGLLEKFSDLNVQCRIRNRPGISDPSSCRHLCGRSPLPPGEG